MIEILKTGDPVRLSFLKAMLEQAELHPFVVGPGPYPGVLLSRVMVPDSEAELAKRLIIEAERDLG